MPGRWTVRVVRTGPLDGGVTVDYTTTNGTAVAGLDYETVAGTLIFEEGQTDQTIAVRIFNDPLIERTEEFNSGSTIQALGRCSAVSAWRRCTSPTGSIRRDHKTGPADQPRGHR